MIPDDLKSEREKENSLMEFVIRKHRNGPLADVPLIFQRGTSTFVNVAKVNEEKEKLFLIAYIIRFCKIVWGGIDEKYRLCHPFFDKKRS